MPKETPPAKQLRALKLKLPKVLAALHQQAQTLRAALNQMESSAASGDSYLLQPQYAREAATILGESFDHPYRLSGALYAQLEYAEGPEIAAGPDARYTLQIPGLLAVPSPTIALAQTLNQTKVQFQQLTSELKNCLHHLSVAERNAELRAALATAGYPRTHLRQSYRQILLCPRRPDALALSWIKARKSIRKVSADWCEKQLVKLDPQGQDSGIQYQRQLLAGLHPSQHALLRQVQVQSRPNLQVAEVFYADQNATENSQAGNSSPSQRGALDSAAIQDTYRQVGYSAMPVLVDGGPSSQLPEFTRVEHEPPAGRRRQRRDLKIDPEPFLPALRVHLHTGT